jgi:hypothetical protein
VNKTHNIVAAALLGVALAAGYASGNDKALAHNAGDSGIAHASAIACHSEGLK